MITYNDDSLFLSCFHGEFTIWVLLHMDLLQPVEPKNLHWVYNLNSQVVSTIGCLTANIGELYTVKQWRYLARLGHMRKTTTTILQCVTRYTATRLVYNLPIFWCGHSHRHRGVAVSDCNSGNSDFRIFGNSVLPQAPKFRNFSSKNSGNSWLPFFALLASSCLVSALCCWSIVSLV